MPYGSYVYRAGSGSYDFRLALPAPAASLLGVRELRRSLATFERSRIDDSAEDRNTESGNQLKAVSRRTAIERTRIGGNG